jgi:thiol-disulfide isomerase/thioredoxin
MRQLNFLALMGLATLFLLCSCSRSGTLLNVGDTLPPLTLETIDGVRFTSDDLSGKVVFLNFFATWCGPCKAELPHLQQAFFEQIQDPNFILLCIGREHSSEELLEFRNQMKLSLPMVADPQRSIYAHFAEQGVPRNIIVDPQGNILWSKWGFDPGEVKRMVQLIQDHLPR